MGGAVLGSLRRVMGIGARDRQIDREPAALAQLALYAHVASVERSEAAGQGQPKSSALLLAVGSRIDLLKLVEYAFDVVCRDPDAVVGDLDLQPVSRLRRSDGDHSFIRRELDGVRDEVENHLSHLAFVRNDVAGTFDIYGNLHLLL